MLSQLPSSDYETQRKSLEDIVTSKITTSPLEYPLLSQHEQMCELVSSTQSFNDEITPRVSPRLSSPIAEEDHRAKQDQQPAKRLHDAIELLPYSHQVGGHTTLWRFSKRAVCKQLNNRENEFYEIIEKHHPELLQFLPRYIGVLNVTFEKQNYSKSKGNDAQDMTFQRLNSSQDKSNSAEETLGNSINDKSPGTSKSACHTPTSHSIGHNQSQSVPKVTFADNRHIIPTSILKPRPLFNENHNRTQSDSASVGCMVSSGNSNNKIIQNIARSPVEPNPWGKTNVNKMLREDVFREVFLQKPIPVRHKKPATHRAIPILRNNSLRNSRSELSLQGTHLNKIQTENTHGKVTGKAPENRSLNEAPHHTQRHNLEVSSGSPTETDVDDQTGRSAPEPEIAYVASKNGKRQRRYSSGGLRRRPTEVADDRGRLKYFEEADDVTFKDDNEIFSMDPEPTEKNTFFPNTTLITGATDVSQVSADSCPSVELNSVKAPIPFSAANDQCSEVPRPVNPKEARAQPGSRVEYFLLLEDLTAGMKRPCIMDLKMGTRQYGVNANSLKQISQRNKCASTTSKELGVRVCGLQVWDVGSQDYIFMDKYSGRRLKSGDEFQKALCRFLYDGVDHSSVLRHIPSILQKLSQLEKLIKGLIGYRFYGTSLLMFYDGAIEEEYSSDSTAAGRDDRCILRDIDFKIADFANCVTKEDVVANKRLCPPQHPNKPDMGFLRGLRSLKRYFLEIQREIRNEKGYTYFQNRPIGSGLESTADSDYDEGSVSC
ncbi:hypothetical protein K3495_g8789 [Podosphaera aphanis]|nr:hypothetical protein K3495_g8789 [Podosphaera aphanis]